MNLRQPHVLMLRSTFEEVAAATQRLRPLLPAWLDAGEQDAIEVATAEALTNIVRHGYGAVAGHAIRLQLEESRVGLAIDIWDRGRPMPDGLLRHADPVTTFGFDPTDLAALPEGGMGLALIKSAFDDVRYASREGVNRLTLVRWI